MKQLMAAYKEKRAAILAEEEKQKEANYALKLQLIDQLKALCESQDDFNKLYNEFKEIQLAITAKDRSDFIVRHYSFRIIT